MQTTCTFCGRKKNDTHIVMGLDGAICQSCLKVVAGEFDKKSNDDKKASQQQRIPVMREENRRPTPTFHAEQHVTFSPSELKEKVDRMVMGQEHAKEQLIMELYKHYHLQARQKNNLFLLGNSGVGKTYLVRSLAKSLDVPFIEVDATMYSETGYKGKEISSIIQELVDKEGGNINRIENAIVFIDEIDKIVSNANGEANHKIQQSLLKLAEGFEAAYTIPTPMGSRNVTVDTSKILFIVAGACVGLEDIVNKDQKKATTIGFRPPNEVKAAETHIATAQDLIDYGFIPEFVGRFPLIIQLGELTDADYRTILVGSEHAIISEYISLFQKEQIDLSFTEDAIQELLTAVKGNPLGVRGVQNALAKHMNNLLFKSMMGEAREITVGQGFLSN